MSEINIQELEKDWGFKNEAEEDDVELFILNAMVDSEVKRHGFSEISWSEELKSAIKDGSDQATKILETRIRALWEILQKRKDEITKQGLSPIESSAGVYHLRPEVQARIQQVDALQFATIWTKYLDKIFKVIDTNFDSAQTTLETELKKYLGLETEGDELAGNLANLSGVKLEQRTRESDNIKQRLDALNVKRKKWNEEKNQLQSVIENWYQEFSGS